METAECLGSLACMLLLSGCVSLQVAGQVEAGRQALLMNNPTEALTHLEQAVQTNPQYVYEAESFREGVWTYLGRAQYETGNLEDARRSFERALALHKDDYLARLYLGLTLARAGDRSAALKQIAFFFKSRRRHTRCLSDWSSDVCSSDLMCSRLWIGSAAMPSSPSCFETGSRRPRAACSDCWASRRIRSRAASTSSSRIC